MRAGIETLPYIRQAEIADLDKIVYMGVAFTEEMRLPQKFDAAIFLDNWSALIQKGNGVIFLLCQEDKVIGALGALIYRDLNDGALITSEAFWFVDEGNRGVGLMLFDEFENWSKYTIKAERVIMTHLSTCMPERLAALYESRGYIKAETNYIKENK